MASNGVSGAARRFGKSSLSWETFRYELYADTGMDIGPCRSDLMRMQPRGDDDDGEEREEGQKADVQEGSSHRTEQYQKQP